jgi:hypothetical protein
MSDIEDFYAEVNSGADVWEDVSEESNKLDYSPMLIIEPAYHGNRRFNVIRDDYLVGGTKQRGMIPLLENSINEEFVYAGPNSGFGQVALAYAAKMTNKRCTLFVAKMRKDHPSTVKAKKLGAKVISVYNGVLKKVQAEAEKYVRSHANTELIPFGADSDIFLKYMVENIQKAIPPKMRTEPPKRIWLVGGSGTLIKILYRVFPDTKFCIVQVGKKIWDDQLDLDRTTKYIAAEQFNEKAVLPPPYPSVASYDAKVWVFVAQHGEDGDYIWNVARD